MTRSALVALLLLAACRKLTDEAPADTDADTDAAGADTDGRLDDTDVPDTDPPAPSLPDACVNELMASNDTVHPVGEAFPDWIELVNPTDVAIDLLGWKISDDAADPGKHTITASLVVPAGGYLVLYADDAGGETPDHLPFKLSKDGEDIVLTDLAGRADHVRFAAMGSDMALGRKSPCCTEPECWRAAYGGTPGAENVLD